ncbi:MAG: VPLPA-CTERM sorting domain-containing protein [Methylomonas sp.]|nr:VPLPA-CTERM sorting domain-containing protein [Methylomonas sp.]PPD21691.1 MAG: VPLPA-CTERM sorting domain-containing protein [Methylomonas sp.]PPD25756.1 MAG: VPLPA-CTERM sorting domain-containing protein [Methylomonas sp.]PPD37003.1 MAG: VPLPA-CTERM sorting domain-containing protein [Methylomonas sp.]PPD40677.1 MAG: VPLPA-CTERM sorting domain-containing protein [Methylomonas sp.]
MNALKTLTLITGLLAITATAKADLTHGPNPYAAGYGFDTPTEASWSIWNRGDVGTLYAEWDTFVDASFPGLRTAAPDVGQFGTAHTHMTWNAGVFRAGSGNLYSFTVPQRYTATLTPTAPLAGPVRAALQFETWGIEMNYASLLLNGLAPTFSAPTYTEGSYQTSFGPVTLVQYLAYWDLPGAATSYQFSFNSPAHQSLAQVAIDIGPVPLPGAIWMFGAGLSGLLAFNRRRRA